MNKFLFFIISIIIFLAYRVMYICYYASLMGFTRKNEIPSGLMITMFAVPAVLFIIMVFVTFKFANKHVIGWDKTSKMITVLYIILIQLLPISDLVFDIFPNPLF